jgi:hypothetical protein
MYLSPRHTPLRFNKHLLPADRLLDAFKFCLQGIETLCLFLRQIASIAGRFVRNPPHLRHDESAAFLQVGELQVLVLCCSKHALSYTN